MKILYLFRSHFIGLTAAIVFLAVSAAAQSEKELDETSGNRWWFTMLFLGVAVLGVAFYLWKKSKNGEPKPAFNYENRYASSKSKAESDSSGTYEIADANGELEWLRKAKQSSKAGARQKAGLKVKPRPQEPSADTKAFQEKMRKLQYSQLPINSFSELTRAKRYEPLPISDDPSVLNAIEQANDEYEEDEAIRELAVRILTAFRTRNSIEALSQIALYDLSSNLRSKAVATLTDFDHETVFETILLACADPTREVRAAAARGLFRLNFDRADAWKRIIETGDEFRMTASARAAIEAGIVVKSFERLVHEDLKVAYEAFALVSLLIRSGETKEIFEAIVSHKDERVRYGLLHCLKVHRDERTLEKLLEVQRESSFPTDVADRIRDVVQSFEAVAA